MNSPRPFLKLVSFSLGLALPLSSVGLAARSDTKEIRLARPSHAEGAIDTQKNKTQKWSLARVPTPGQNYWESITRAERKRLKQFANHPSLSKEQLEARWVKFREMQLSEEEIWNKIRKKSNAIAKSIAIAEQKEALLRRLQANSEKSRIKITARKKSGTSEYRNYWGNLELKAEVEVDPETIAAEIIEERNLALHNLADAQVLVLLDSFRESAGLNPGAQVVTSAAAVSGIAHLVSYLLAIESDVAISLPFISWGLSKLFHTTLIKIGRVNARSPVLLITALAHRIRYLRRQKHFANLLNQAFEHAGLKPDALAFLPSTRITKMIERCEPLLLQLPQKNQTPLQEGSGSGET